MLNIIKLKENKDVVAEFYRWAEGITKTNFSAKLFTLACKADSDNRIRLEQGFPMEMYLIKNYRDVDGWYEEFKKSYEEIMKNEI